MEIEFKLSCTPDTATALGRQLSRLTKAAPQKVKLQNTYYDTPQQDLRSLGIALRIRQQDKLHLQTVKCAGHVSGGLSSRPEWETPYTGRFDFTAVDNETVRAQLEILAKLPGYRATLDTNFSRHIWHWRPEAGTHVEIVLDRGRILAGGREEAICELELELVEGKAERLLDLVAHLGELAPLFPAPLSKATRGNLLLAGNSRMVSTEAASAATCQEAFILMAQTCLDHISINLPANCATFNAENLHQVRVGMRRLRALLQLFRPLLRSSWCREAIVQGAREHMRAIAPARSLQVLITEILAPAESAIEPRAWRRLHMRLSGEAERSFAAARDHLLSHAFAYWLLHASLALHACPIRRRLREQSWPQQADRLLAERVKKYTKQLKNGIADPEAMHELRKTGKHLRYQLAVTGQSNTAHGKALPRQLGRLQDTLGQLNDLYSAAEVLNRQPASFAAAIASLGDVYHERHTTLLQALPKQLGRVRHDLAAMPVKQKGKR
jgi:inorganic triphosphatase YgiF